MNANLPPAEVLLALESLSGGKLTRRRDLATLIELAQRTQRGETLAELSFQAKFVANTSRILQRIGPDAEGARVLSAEMQKGVETVKRLIGEVLQQATGEQRAEFDATYFRLTPEALQNVFALCNDLSWYKNWLLETRPRHAARAGSSALWRGALFVMIVGAVFWLGSVFARAVLANDLLVPGTLTLNPSTPPAVEHHVYLQLSGLGIVMIAGYLLVLASSIVFLASSPFRLREHGWLTMAAIMFFVFVPVEAFTMVIDMRMILMAFGDRGTLPALRELFLARVNALAGAPLVGILCYYTIILLAVVQPFRLRAEASR